MSEIIPGHTPGSQPAFVHQQPAAGLRPALVWRPAQMMRPLSVRLFLSYLLLLVVTLGVISGAFVLLVATRPVSAQPVYAQLSAQAAALPLRNLWEQVFGRRFNPALDQVTELTTGLATMAQSSGLRLLLINDRARTVIWDSGGGFGSGSVIRADFNPYPLPAGLLLNPRNFGPPGGSTQGIAGVFLTPDDAEWLFIGIEAAASRLADEHVVLIFAQPRPVRTLGSALMAFGADFGTVLLQASVVGVIAASVLALVISRSIARPLRTVADYALAMSPGDPMPLPLTGPSEVQAVAEAFNRMSAEVRAEQHSQQDFLANVSHDLKTPLTSIQGFSQAIIDGAARDPVAAARIIHEEAARMNRMVIELTDLARLQAGRLSMTMQPLDLGMLARAMGERLAIVAQEKNITLHVDAPAMPPVSGDGDRLVQVLTNLIGNAIKYTPPGGTVTVRTAMRASGVEVSVQDTGVGISADALPRIFERFYQVDKARGPQRGTGLGLAIVQEIVTAHGGTITASSAGEGWGSTFVVWLPAPTTSTTIRRRP